MTALKFVLADTRHLKLPRLERFVSRWVEEALWFWAASSNENFLTEDVVIALFDKLVVPLEEANSLWCLPAFY